eukprot:jgi/Bigna1/79561/fgenesh1_pg.63_\
MAGGPPPPDPSEKQKNEGDRRVAIILRGKKVLEYSIPGFIPEWMLPEITPPSVFDDPMGTFEPTFGSVQRPRTLGKKRTEETRGGAAQQEHASAVRQNDTDGERGRRVYDWSSGKDRRISRSAPSSTPPGSSSGEHSKRTYGGVDYSNNDLTRQRSEGSETSQRGGGLGIGGTTVLILYVMQWQLRSVDMIIELHGVGSIKLRLVINNQVHHCVLCNRTARATGRSGEIGIFRWGHRYHVCEGQPVKKGLVMLCAKRDLCSAPDGLLAFAARGPLARVEKYYFVGMCTMYI